MKHRNRIRAPQPFLITTFLLCFFSILCLSIISQAQQGWQAYEQGDLARVNEYLQSGKLKNDEADFLRAALCVDADSAVAMYRQVVLRYPESPFSRRALDRLRQYYEAQGQQAKADEIKKTLRHWKAPEKTLLEIESAPEAAVKKTPIAEPAKEKPKAKKPVVRAEQQPSKSKFSVQVGAFSTFKNAKRLMLQLQEAGYQVTILDPTPNSKLHMVRVTGFANEDEANKTAKEIEARFNLKTIIVPEK